MQPEDIQAIAAAVADALAARMVPEVLSTEEAARYLGLQPSTLEIYRSRGGGPRFARLGGRVVRYRRVDLDEWLQEHAQRSTSDHRGVRR